MHAATGARLSAAFWVLEVQFKMWKYNFGAFLLGASVLAKKTILFL